MHMLKKLQTSTIAICAEHGAIMLVQLLGVIPLALA